MTRRMAVMMIGKSVLGELEILERFRLLLICIIVCDSPTYALWFLVKAVMDMIA